MGVTIQTNYAVGDSVMVNKDDEKFKAVIDTVSFMQFKTSDGLLVSDIVYIGLDDMGCRRVFHESECNVNESITI